MFKSGASFATAHTFCASWDMPTQSNGIFARFMTMREKMMSAKAIEIQMKIGGNHAFFRDKYASIRKKCCTLFCILKFRLRIIVGE